MHSLSWFSILAVIGQRQEPHQPIRSRATGFATRVQPGPLLAETPCTPGKKDQPIRFNLIRRQRPTTAVVCWYLGPLYRSIVDFFAPLCPPIGAHLFQLSVLPAELKHPIGYIALYQLWHLDCALVHLFWLNIHFFFANPVKVEYLYSPKQIIYEFGNV